MSDQGEHDDIDDNDDEDDEYSLCEINALLHMVACLWRLVGVDVDQVNLKISSYIWILKIYWVQKISYKTF